MSWLDIERIFFTIMGYPMSYVEFFGTVAGLLAVWLSARGHVISWPIGIINVVLLFFLFYQIRLYPDMLLQVFFLVTNLAGWWRWKNPESFESDRKNELRVSLLNRQEKIASILITVSGSLLLGSGAARLNIWFPGVFPQPSAFPFADSFVTVISILAQYWMVQKKAECWLMWITADVVATGLYYAKDVRFLALEYLIFCFIAAHGYLTWKRQEMLDRQMP